MSGARPAGERLPPVRKSLGQHFLTDRRILGRIADALDLTGTETVVEVGPGRGALTEELLPRCRRLVAIEYDRKLAELLRERYTGEPRLTVVQADVLETDLADAAGTSDFVLVGNVPYYITTPILFHALQPPRPRRAVYLVQREVADRAASEPGSRVYGALSVNVQAVATVRSLFRVPPGAFQPPPKVESAVIRIEPRDQALVTPAEEQPFRRLVQEAFGMRRKQLGRVVRTIYSLDAEQAEALVRSVELDPMARPETLSPQDFARLLRAVSGLGRAAGGPAPSPGS